MAILASSVKRYRRCRRQEPLLMFFGGEDSSAANLYSISDQKIFTIPNQPDPPIANRICLGSACGWLITADERSELSLLNPITGQQFDLPPVSTVDHITPLRRDPDGRITDYGLEIEGDILDYSAESLRYFLYVKAALSSSPSIDDDYVVVLLLGQPYSLSFARSGDKKWTTTIGPECPRFDIMYHNNDGKVYTVLWRSREVESWDFSQKDGSLPEPVVFVPKPELKAPRLFHLSYLVHTPWGELLLVRTMEYLSTRRIEVYKVDSDTRKMVRVKSLGDYALFLGGHYPICISSSCISSKDVPGLKGNCVYFNDELLEKPQALRNCRRDIGIFNLEDGSIEPILPDDSRPDRPLPFWFLPSLV